MYPTAIMAVSLAASAAFAGWTVQGWRMETRLAEVRTEYANAQVRAVERAQSETIRLQAQADAAARQHAARAAALAHDVRRSDAALGLLHSAADAAISAAQASHETCQRVATTSTDLLQSCSREYRSVAAEADQWVNRAMTLDEAWPSAKP